MQLTRVLLYYIRHRHIPGKIDIGKNRVVARMKPQIKYAAMRQMVAEQRNMDTLSQPYLTEAEDQFHEVLMASKEEENAIKAIEERRKENWYKNRHMEDELLHLNVNKSWE